MTGKLSKNFHGVAIGPLSNILAVKYYYFFSTCALCNKELPLSDSSGALDHFSTHIWVKLQETNKSDNLLDYLLMSLPLDKWLEHQGLSKDHGDGRSFMKEMKKRAQDIIR